MMLRVALVLVSVLGAAPSFAAQPDPFEPWLAPRYQSPREVKPERVPRIAPAPRRVEAPPPIVVPQTGRVLPNLPAAVPETAQDRAIRCHHQAGMYGQAAGDRGAYIGGCITQ